MCNSEGLGYKLSKYNSKKVSTTVAITMLKSSLSLPKKCIAMAVPIDVARIISKFPESITVLKSRSCCSRIFWAIFAFLIPFSIRFLNLILFTAIKAISQLESRAISIMQSIMIKKLVRLGSICFYLSFEITASATSDVVAAVGSSGDGFIS